MEVNVELLFAITTVYKYSTSGISCSIIALSVLLKVTSKGKSKVMYELVNLSVRVYLAVIFKYHILAGEYI
jgi:hypothetical protein